MLRGFDQIVATPDVRFGKPRIAGTRITVVDILEWLASGMTEAEIISDFPELTQQSIRQALAYSANRGSHTQVIAA